MKAHMQISWSAMIWLCVAVCLSCDPARRNASVQQKPSRESEPPAVPDNVLTGPWEMNGAGGVINIRFDSLQEWLTRGGAKALFVALADERPLSQALPSMQVPSLSDPWRVKDLAYQLVIHDPARAIRVRDNLAKRDELIAKYLQQMLNVVGRAQQT
jgi:hypothetical protein